MAKRTAAPRRSARAFLKQVADELPSHLPPRLRDFSAEQWGRYYKVWFGEEKKIHFEVQFIAGGRLEIGLHLESDPDTNERIAGALERKGAAIRRALGERAGFGSHGNGWRFLAERWSGGDLRNEEAATEAAARLAEYVVTVSPLLSKPAR
ncbi:MAG: hypothetical protein ACRDKS_05055 [Actinomycetota bacterium]